MKKRSEGFLSNEKICHNSEQFDYIKELHDYLWKFVRFQIPTASGRLENFLDASVEIAKNKTKEA
jgi:hypothetical protein